MSAAGNVTFKLTIDADICRHCRRCMAGDACRGNAFLRFDLDDSPFIDMSRCWGCLICTSACPFGAIRREDYGQRAASVMG